MPQSPELAGGEGFTFEGHVAAFYLAALLAEAYAPGIEDRTVIRVSVQQRDFGEPLDDVVVDLQDAAKDPARLSLQVKRSLTISKAETNTDFREIIRDSWATLQKSGFRINTDRYGAAVGTISASKERDTKTLCDWARESLTSDHFDARFEAVGSASAKIEAVKDDIVALLNESKGAPCTSQEVHQFLAHFVLIQFDFLREGAIDPPDAINRVRGCLAPDEAAKAPLVWSRVVQLARASAGKSGQFDRARLVRSLSPIVRLRGATSLRLDLDKLAELAKGYATLITDDVGGTRLDRTWVLKELDAKLTSARVVQVRGLPGSGKSVVIRRVVERALERGPVLFLKAEQLQGTSWVGYAASHGLSGAPLQDLLVEVGASGTPILFIDAIDRIEKEHQPVILDLIRVIRDSPLVDNWRVVVSLRDTGIEVLRNWLAEFLDALKVDTLGVGELSDEEAEILARAKPHLRPLLFGSIQVRAIVRRPFFAKVLNQGCMAASWGPGFAPKSEIDLIENWWLRGGYNATGRNALERQRALLELARVQARQLGQPINLSQITSIAQIDDLRSDGILQDARRGISIRFAHDILFEWAFFHVLADRGGQWMEEIKVCGEPPAIARAVELASQWEYARGKDWRLYLTQTEDPKIRSQWMRAWLVGPLGSAAFDADVDQFERAVFADDFRLFRKVLVWFQAEKTSPNAGILAGALPEEQRQRFADLLGWPSDFAAWRRLIEFILRRISSIPQRLHLEVVAIFEVWQNALAGLPNPTSRALLQQCANWLTVSHRNADTLGNADDFRSALRRMVLRAAHAEPTFAEEYLRRLIDAERVRDDEFQEIVAASYVLAQSLPRSIVNLSLAVLCDELPEERISREEEDERRRTEWIEAVLAKPKSERTPLETAALSGGPSLRTIGDFSSYDWDRLSIHDDYRSFNPPSPLREPFHSLFRSSPDEALRLLRRLCNHAIGAWRQLHLRSRERRGTPIPLDLTFPWGTQRFWGTDREYLWFRAIWAPHAIGAGFMALEEWCFAELGRGRPVDELIQQVVAGNECIAVLGAASMCALQTNTVSEVTLTLVTSQRLLAADHNRWAQDLSPTASLMGFTSRADKSHVEAIQAANARPVRKKELRWMVPRFVFGTRSIGDRARQAILNFKNALPYRYEEERDNSAAREHFTAQALEYVELADEQNYQAHRTTEDSAEIAIVHVRPSASRPENLVKAEKASRHLGQAALWTWACKSFDERKVSETYTVDAAIAAARQVDSAGLFQRTDAERCEELLGMRRGAVAGTAAIALTFRDGLAEADLQWARDVLGRAARLPEEPDLMWSHASVIPWHHGIYVARGLAADLRKGTASPGAPRELLGLIAHPLDGVSVVALEQACMLWFKDPKLTWAALILAFSLCHVPARPRDEVRERGDALHSSSDAEAAVDSALSEYEARGGWTSFPVPPPAWVKADGGQRVRGRRRQGEGYTAEMWVEPEGFWYSKRAAEILKLIPLEEVMESEARTVLLDFLASCLNWTNQKNSPPWAVAGHREHSAIEILEWTYTLGSTLGRAAGLMNLSECRACFLDVILSLEDDSCWPLLSHFVSTYICRYVYDALVVPAEAVPILDLCLGRFLRASVFERSRYRSGELSGFDQPELVRVLMFVSIEHAGRAARYVNGDWTEISRILPLIDRFVRACGWAASVMDPFLTFCERARTHYSGEAFADEVLAIIGEGPGNLKGWQGTFITARISELVQYLAHREAPMTLALAQKFLRILDILVDLGDRRSAALQLSESFRGVRLPTQS